MIEGKNVEGVQAQSLRALQWILDIASGASLLHLVFRWIDRRWWKDDAKSYAHTTAFITYVIGIGVGFVLNLLQTDHQGLWKTAPWLIAFAGSFVWVAYREVPYPREPRDPNDFSCPRCGNVDDEVGWISKEFVAARAKTKSGKNGYAGCLVCGLPLGPFRWRTPRWIGLVTSSYRVEAFALNTPDDVQRFSAYSEPLPSWKAKMLVLRSAEGDFAPIYVSGSESAHD